MNGLAPRTQRNTPRSTATEARTADSTIAGASTHHPRPRVGQEVGDVGADRDQLGVGEVDEVHHAEDQRDAEGEQGVRAAPADPVDERLDEVRHGRDRPLAPTRRSVAHPGGPPTKCAEEVLVGGELGAGALEGDAAGAQQVAAVGDLEGPPGVLLDDEDRAAPAAEVDAAGRTRRRP